MGNRPTRLSPTQAHEAIQRILERPGSISFTHHSGGRSREREFTADDVWRVLRFGRIQGEAEWAETHGNWVHRVCGIGYDREPLVVKVVIEINAERLRVITAHGD